MRAPSVENHGCSLASPLCPLCLQSALTILVQISKKWNSSISIHLLPVSYDRFTGHPHTGRLNMNEDRIESCQRAKYVFCWEDKSWCRVALYVEVLTVFTYIDLLDVEATGTLSVLGLRLTNPWQRWINYSVFP